jgi:hypothetical protein
VKRNTPHQSQQGFVTIAQNGEVDYLRLAYVQALSIKATMPGSEYAVIVDAETMKSVTEQHRKVFDYVIEMPHDYSGDVAWKLMNEWQVFWLTPFKETIKLEADLLIPRDIGHWWHTFRLRDVVLSNGCRDYQERISVNKRYRRIFESNDLPDVYNGLMYFRFSETASRFFRLAMSIFLNWDEIRDPLLMHCEVALPTTDLVYAIAAKTIGIELTTLPVDFINFVHMKPSINNWPEDTAFHRAVSVVVDAPDIRINNVQQYHPVHYHYKDFITDEMIKDYERAAGIN